ncbi:MAG: hypothetical protein EOP60_03950 [Sphingomonadales bacterium]|nr:MAG: hypothetical protein EOP60_03950 [Sphingomonadales bacterium]
MILAMTLALSLQTVTAGQTVARPLQPKTPIYTWVTSDDYPARALTNGAFGATKFQLDVDATGKPAACHVLNTSGFWALDRRVCWLMMKRAAFIPALDSTGAPIAAVFRSNFTFRNGDADQGDWLKLVKEVTEPKVLEVTVRKLPASYKEPPLIRVRFEGTKPAECLVELGSGSAAIDSAACAQAMILARLPETKGAGYRPPDTRIFLVPFLPEASPPP